MMTAIMEAPYPQPYQYNAITLFFTARALGFGLTAAYGAQAVATIISIAIAVWLWRPGRQVSHQERVALTAVLAILATPYGYTYDTIGLAVAVAMLAAMTSRPPRLILAICWLWPFVTHYFTWGGYCVAVLVPLFLARGCCLRYGREAGRLKSPQSRRWRSGSGRSRSGATAPAIFRLA
ncbi:MAG: hypothetical protein E5V96_13385 [Mesorhizobium sp.]|nr:MAG: hypothetical protein E5V96_13385 [Mesorhizobium sp.]